MTTIDISQMTEDELNAIDAEIRKTMKMRHQTRLRAEIDALKTYGRAQGFLVDEIFADRETALVPKFRHPESPELTWSGRGRRPDWLNSEIIKGATLDDFRVN